VLWFDVDFLNLATRHEFERVPEQLWFDVDFLNLATELISLVRELRLWFDVDFLNLATVAGIYAMPEGCGLM